MTISCKGKSVEAMHYKGKAVSAIWYKGKQVWSGDVLWSVVNTSTMKVVQQGIKSGDTIKATLQTQFSLLPSTILPITSIVSAPSQTFLKSAMQGDYFTFTPTTPSSRTVILQASNGKQYTFYIVGI